MLPYGVPHDDDSDDRDGLKIDFSSSTKSFPVSKSGGIDMTGRFEDGGDEKDSSLIGIRQLNRGTLPSLNKCTVHATLHPPVPLSEGVIPEISPDSFLAALVEDAGIKDPEALHGNCYEAVKTLKGKRVLDKYVLNEDEAAVVCAIPMLLEEEEEEEEEEEGFLIHKMVESCTDNVPRMLLTMMLTALRKLPRYRGLLYFEGRKAKEEETSERKDGETIRPSFCVASKDMIEENEDTKAHSNREVFRVEDGWGYDISDFVVKRDESGCYGKTKLESIGTT